MLYQSIQYIRFLFNSTNQHGVHSPFVFNLVTQCFYDTTDHKAYHQLKQYRQELIKDKRRIHVTDLGAGSQVMKRQERKISRIAERAGTTLSRAKLLFRLSQYFNCQTVLELGTSLGMATYALSLGNPKVRLTTIEGCPNLAAHTQQQLQNHGATQIESINGAFGNVLQQVKSNNYDLVFFDGNHQKEATLAYFDTLLDTAHNDSLFIFDDIYWSKGMTEAWETIKQHPRVTVTIDTFFWGMVFFRKEQAKEHFRIRV
ncbi:O-methyltransferase [Aestuariivivens sediminicola]|uniref:O-methyltransferase n=1 Tax=Aestuariivivens sediminicola TaxID=2913560 RepID=UPI001F586D07|nr:class I SAM-dependent methyltransferase [Aestuariivivens sediminicola]